MDAIVRVDEIDFFIWRGDCWTLCASQSLLAQIQRVENEQNNPHWMFSSTLKFAIM